MSKETVSTIGQQKQSNYALRANMTEQEFVKEVPMGCCLLRIFWYECGP
jgi:hydroxyacylglutathione hydrolase